MKKKILIAISFILCFMSLFMINVDAKTSYPFAIKIDEPEHQKSIKPYGKDYYYSEGFMFWKKEYYVHYSMYTGYHYELHLQKATSSIYYDSNLTPSGVTLSLTDTMTVSESESYSTTVQISGQLGNTNSKLVGGFSRTKTKTTTFTCGVSKGTSYLINGASGWYSIDVVIEADEILCNRFVKTNGKYELLDTYCVFAFRCDEPGLKLYYTKEQH